MFILRAIDKLEAKVLFISVIFTALIMACGGGGGGGETPPDDTAFKVSGVVSKGFIKNGSVSVFSIASNGFKTEPAMATTTTDAKGVYSVELDYSGPLLVEVSGGTYIDEATGTEVAMTGVLRAALADVSGPVEIAVSPLTELAVRRAELGGKLLATHIQAANELVGQLIGCDIIATLPLNPQDSQEFGAGTANEKSYTLMLAAFSQMASQIAFDDIDAVLDALDDDLADARLDETHSDLSQALTSFLEGEYNQTGAGTGDGTKLQNLIGKAGEGLEPTGDLAEAEKLLGALFQATDAERKDAFDALDSYLETFVPASKEAHLFSALGSLMKVYSIDAATFVKDDLGIDFDADFEAMDWGVVLDTFLRLAAYDSDADALFAGIAAQLNEVLKDLAAAEGANAMISVTGIDATLVDDIDIKVLKALSMLFRAGCLYAQSVDTFVSVWEVPVEGGPAIDARDLIGTEEDLTQAQIEALLDNNPSLFTYKNTTIRNDAIEEIKDAVTAYQAAVATLDNLGEEGRKARNRNAFGVNTELDFWRNKGLSEYSLPSLVAAADNPAEAIIGVETDGICEEVIIGEDGYAYHTEYHDIYLESVSPNSALPVDHQHTLYSVLNDADGIRKLFDTMLVYEGEIELYTLSNRSLYKTDIPEVEWEEPIDTHTLPAAAIAIDGSGNDWGAVPVFKTLDDLTIKMARDAGGAYFVLVTRKEGLVENDFSYASFGFGMYDWGGCNGDAFYRLDLSISEWDGSLSLHVTDAYYPVEESDYELVTQDGVVIGIEVRSEHIDRLTRQGGHNFFSVNYDREPPAGYLNKFWNVKFLPQATNQ
jgi:hypothetical protein